MRSGCSSSSLSSSASASSASASAPEGSASANVVRGGAGGGVPSVSEAEQRVLDNPKDAKAFRDLATAQQAAGNTDGAIEAIDELHRAPAEGYGRAPRARRPLPAAGIDRAGARADLPGALRLLRSRRRFATRSSRSAAARSRPTRSRTP